MQAHEIHSHEWWWQHELIWIIFVLVLIALALISVRPLIRSWLTRQNPEEIVRRRFARGEVDEEEFGKILKRLRG